MKTIIKNARILHEGQIQPLEMSFDQSEILEIAPEITADADDVILDAKNRIVLPGLIDAHVHLREPGFEGSETIETGTMAAAHGGVTTLFAMPNLRPFPSRVETVKDYLKQIDEKAKVRVLPFATITVDEQGKELTDYKAIKDLGVAWFSDDGVGVQSDEVMEKAIAQAAEDGVLFSCHTEDMAYRKPLASVHLSKVNEDKGWVGIPSECESEPLKRDLKLVEKHPMKYHACHISAKESVEALAQAKTKGLDVSGEVTAHHLLLEDKDVISTNHKMNPPLRSHDDRMALIEGLESGALDIIANDHAPHPEAMKQKSMEQAPFGIVSLETSFILLYDEFVKSGRWSLPQLVNWMSTAPAKRFELEKSGELKEGYRPDFFIFDENRSQVIDKDAFFSKGKNTPFDGWKVDGTIMDTYVMGQPVFHQPETTA